MLAKLTVKNQLTLPKVIAAQFSGVEYFEVRSDGDSIVLNPLRRSQSDAVREQLSQMGIVEQDLADAVVCARQQP